VPSVSSEGVTPRSSLVRAHVPLPLVSLLLRHLASFEASWQVVRSPCCPGELPDVISKNLSLDAGSRAPAVPLLALTCFFRSVIGLLPGRMGSASRFVPQDDFSRAVFRGCRYSVMFRPPILFAPRSSLPLRILPQGSRGFYVRAYRASLPPHAPDILTVRLQAIDGTRTFTLPDSQPCRLLIFLILSFAAFRFHIAATVRAALRQRCGDLFIHSRRNRTTRLPAVAAAGFASRTLRIGFGIAPRVRGSLAFASTQRGFQFSRQSLRLPL